MPRIFQSPHTIGFKTKATHADRLGRTNNGHVGTLTSATARRRNADTRDGRYAARAGAFARPAAIHSAGADGVRVAGSAVRRRQSLSLGSGRRARSRTRTADRVHREVTRALGLARAASQLLTGRGGSGCQAGATAFGGDGRDLGDGRAARSVSGLFAMGCAKACGDGARADCCVASSWYSVGSSRTDISAASACGKQS